jgi:hypothetical protein
MQRFIAECIQFDILHLQKIFIVKHTHVLLLTRMSDQSSVAQLLVKSNATLVKSEEHLPSRGNETMRNGELDKERESRNKSQNRHLTWH